MEDPLDHKGKIKEPLLSSSTTKGGLRALVFIIGTYILKKKKTIMYIML
jgi:5-hydroxyisourate hydrolase-like protein (transthyretin family)